MSILSVSACPSFEGNVCMLTRVAAPGIRRHFGAGTRSFCIMKSASVLTTSWLARQRSEYVGSRTVLPISYGRGKRRATSGLASQYSPSALAESNSATSTESSVYTL